MFKKIFYPVLFLYFFGFGSQTSAQPFVTRVGNHFEIGGKPYYYIGTNFWYGAIVASKGEGGNRKRLAQELDFLKLKGFNNLRVMVGGDGPNGVPTRIEPTLQTSPGVYNDTIFDGLDYLLKEMGKRHMYAVLYINNSWEWSGGYSQYLNWAGYGPFPLLNIDGWDVFRKYVAKYADCEPCHEMFKNHVRNVLARTNRYTGKKYTDDPAIMAWQIGNEPRAFSDEAKPGYIKWIKEVVAYIRQLDSHHLLTVGSEGEKGSEEDIHLWETVHNDPNIDYTTIHIWPYNWSWIDRKDLNLKKDLAKAIDLSVDYVQRHCAIAQKLNKPLVIEEFGFPRDSMRFTPQSPVTCRDRFYGALFAQLVKSASQKGALAGCNFWTWGGNGRAVHKFWQKGDDYLGDPAQEEQGLNSVFNTDSTVKLAQDNIRKMQHNTK